MKHIKLHEEYNQDLKKYIIIKINNRFLILEIIEKIIDEFKVKILYEFTNELIKKNFNSKIKEKTLKNNILYQSNNLKDCIKKISILHFSQNYNL